MYKITYEDRCVIEKRREEGWGCRKIAKALGLSKTAVFHELKSKSNQTGKYKAEIAHFKSQQIRHRYKHSQRKINNSQILDIVEKQLKRKKSPYDIACYIKRKYPKPFHISYETIYNIIFSCKNTASHRCENWYKQLRYKCKKRHVRGYLSLYRAKKRYFPSLTKMSEAARKQFSVWEVDTMYLKSGFIVAAVERLSKKIMAAPIPNLKAETMNHAMRFLFSRVVKVAAVICGRGSENIHFTNWQRFLHARVYACAPGSPWQKGLVESSIRQLRCTFKRDRLYSTISNKEIYTEAARLNNMHRFSLNGKNSNQIYYQNLAKAS